MNIKHRLLFRSILIALSLTIAASVASAATVVKPPE